ncbi:MAG: class I SAM-dependent methyltransferase [Acidobacteria bacterium]|nr:class I SAM-dependent methyltransferase [Acidobacteriota bacterium]
MKSATYWDQITTGFIRHRHRGIWREFTDQLNQSLVAELLAGPPAGRILKTDLFDEAMLKGVVDPMARIASEVHGIDISDLVARTAAEQNPNAIFRQASVTQIPYPDQYFDTVVSLSTLDQLETIEEVHQGLSEIHRVLAPGGRLLITFDNRSNPLIAVRKYLPFICGPYFMGESVRVAQLKPLLESRGFQLQRIFTYMHAPRVLAVKICRLLEHKPYAPTIAKLRLFEALDNWPTRNWTANYIGAIVQK